MRRWPSSRQPIDRAATGVLSMILTARAPSSAHSPARSSRRSIATSRRLHTSPPTFMAARGNTTPKVAAAVPNREPARPAEILAPAPVLALGAFVIGVGLQWLRPISLLPPVGEFHRRRRPDRPRARYPLQRCQHDPGDRQITGPRGRTVGPPHRWSVCELPEPDLSRGRRGLSRPNGPPQQPLAARPARRLCLVFRSDCQTRGGVSRGPVRRRVLDVSGDRSPVALRGIAHRRFADLILRIYCDRSDMSCPLFGAAF